MRKGQGSFFRTAVLEEYNVDAAIEESRALDGNTPEDLEVKSELIAEEDKATETNNTAAVDSDVMPETEADSEVAITDFDSSDEAVAVESIFAAIERAKRVCYSLEEIANIIENSEETGGIDSVSMPVVQQAIGSLYSEIGETETPFSSIAQESISSVSARLKVARESINSLKTKAVEIWKAIVAFFSKIFKFIKEVIRNSEFKVSKHKEDLEKLKRAYKFNKDKIDKNTKKEQIRGPIFALLTLSENEVSAEEILKAGDVTLASVSDFISDLSTHIVKSVESVKALKAKVSGFEQLVDDDGGDEDKSELIMSVVKADPLLVRPRVTEFAGNSSNSEVYNFVSKRLAGGYTFSYSLPKKKDFSISELDNVKLNLTENDDHHAKTNFVYALESKDFDAAFTLIEGVIGIHDKLRIEILRFTDELEKFVKSDNNIERELLKGSNDAMVHPVVNNLKMFRHYVEAVNRFYVKSSMTTEGFVNRYIETLIQYTTTSLKIFI